MTTATSDTTSAQSVYQNLTAAQTKTTSKTDDAQNRFLKLLTTQLKNQDPMNPVDNAQTTSQLAQISTVDGVERLNTTLQSLVGSYRTSETLQAASMVGHGVLVDGNQLNLKDGIAIGGYTLDEAADKVNISILDSSGVEIANETLSNLDAGSHDFGWDGATLNGSTAADGKYTIKVTATKGNAKIGASALEMATVTSVINTDSGVTMEAGRFGSLKLSDIRRII